MTPEPKPELVPVTANAGSTPGSLADQTESLMPTIREDYWVQVLMVGAKSCTSKSFSRCVEKVLVQKKYLVIDNWSR